MNQIKDFFKRMKFPRLPARFSRMRPIHWITAAVTLALVIGGFFIARGVVRCWEITNLPGTSPADCGEGSNSGLNDPTTGE